jgi:hypothetical protein
LAGLYILARSLIYNQISVHLSALLLGALAFSTIGFVLALGSRGLEGIDLPANARLHTSSGVLTAIGLFLLGLGVLSTLVRQTAALGTPSWYEAPVIAILASALTLWVFPGFRSEIGGFLASRIATGGGGAKLAVERLEGCLSGIQSREQILEPLGALVQELLGPVQLQLWSLQHETGDMVPVGHTGAPTLPRRHPLTTALRGRTRPLPVAGEATRMQEIPLHVGARDICEGLGLRVFFPITSGRKLVGILGCGPGGGRTLHPEDLDLLQTLADHLGAVLMQDGVRSIDSWAGRARGGGGGEGA